MDSGHQHDVQGQNVLLDIGDDVGALVIYTGPERSGQEIEICSARDAAARVHSQVHARQAGGSTLHAAVYPQLGAGDYRVCLDEPGPGRAFSVAGGRVTEIDLP